MNQIADENSDIHDAADALQDSMRKGQGHSPFLMRTDASKFGHITRSVEQTDSLQKKEEWLSVKAGP